VPTHAEQKVLPYSAQQLYGLVADVDRYPEFLPWCLAVRVRRREGPTMHADMSIGFRVFRETFTSRVTIEGIQEATVAFRGSVTSTTARPS